MKKCPECGNLSYDGAPVCGNCGAKFSKKGSSSKGSLFKDSVTSTNKPKKEKLRPKTFEITEFKKESKPTDIDDLTEPVIEKIIPEPKVEKKVEEKKESIIKLNKEDEKSTLEIIKEKKTVIGIILLITIIIIGIIIVTAPTHTTNNDTSVVSGDLVDYTLDGFSFKVPASWKETGENDSSKIASITFAKDDKTKIKIYTIANDASSLKDINRERIEVALGDNAYVEFVQSITIDEKNASNIILENSDGDYTRYVSLFDNGKLYVFKITGESYNSVTSEDIEKVIQSAHIG